MSGMDSILLLYAAGLICAAVLSYLLGLRGALFISLLFAIASNITTEYLLMKRDRKKERIDKND